MPNHMQIREHKHLRVFGNLLQDPNLFHLNRHSVAEAFAVGLFVAWMPIPFQMVLAAALAIYLRVNLPISVALVWISNPVTMPAMFYFAYRVGTWILRIPKGHFHIELSLEWLTSGLLAIWQPFLLGCFVMAVGSSLLGNLAVRLLWRLSIIRKMKKKKIRRYKPPQS